MIQHRSPSIRAGVVVGVLLVFSPSWVACRPASAAGPRRIDWRAELGRAQSEARERNLPLWIQFTGSWCHYCHLMDRDSFTHTGIVGHSLQSFVPLKLQCDAHEDLAHRLGITGLPASVIVSPTGEIIAKHEGYVDGDTFLGFLQGALRRVGPAQRAASPSSDSPAPEVGSAGEREVALAGYCPVSLVRAHRLVSGQETLSLVYAGRVYKFADAKGRYEFQKQPQRFSPVNGGRCPVTQVDQGESRQGDPRFGILYGGHLYLCAEERERGRFLENPLRYAHVNMAERELCPHCWANDELPSHNLLPTDSLVAGRDDLFPNVPGRVAFPDDAKTVRR